VPSARQSKLPPIKAEFGTGMTFYCPICWNGVSRDEQTCAHCGSNLAVADARPMAEKHWSALQHPEPETAVRAAWILGERREVQAVPD
jgi:predicted amidophosphoribosyltransferase